MLLFRLSALGTVWAYASATYTISRTPLGLLVLEGNKTIVNNSAILSGNENCTADTFNGSRGITYEFITPTIAKISLSLFQHFTGARFSDQHKSHFYGVWEYPWHNRIENVNISFALAGVGDHVGTNWANARAPFFVSSAGYGVYTDTLKMGTYSFNVPGEAQFIFNSSALEYYVILPREPRNFKSIIEQYTNLSARSEMPPTSGLGPTFWSDDFTQDFHGTVSNAAENIFDMVNHLRDLRIRATSTFADRPYGTGNRSWGNFDFDPAQYPNPEGFIANLTEAGFDFQVWIANRAQRGTKLYNASISNDWLFDVEGVPKGNLGEALNLSKPDAYTYFDEQLRYFSNVGVKGFKIDRGEEGEMPEWVQNEQMDIFLDLAYDTMVSRFGKAGFYSFARSANDRSRAKTHIWNGDSHANFTGLAYSVSSGIRSGIISFPIWGSDTGGYVRKDFGGVATPSEEVWARWMWFSAFSPVYEFMLGTNHTPWYAPYDNTSTVEILRKTANLHADLTPYIKSYAFQASKTGLPIIRALFLEASGDENTWAVNDAYFFGEELLIAPIVEEGGSRTVYFPKGPSDKYLDFFEKKRVHLAGTTARVSHDLNSAPVFVKEGAIILRGDVFQGNAKWIRDWRPSLRIEVYPSYNVPVSSFVYFHGEGGEGREVRIALKTEKTGRKVRLEYEDLGVKAVVIWFLKGVEGGKEMELYRGEGSIELSDVDCLF